MSGRWTAFVLGLKLVILFITLLFTVHMIYICIFENEVLYLNMIFGIMYKWECL